MTLLIRMHKDRECVITKINIKLLLDLSPCQIIYLYQLIRTICIKNYLVRCFYVQFGNGAIMKIYGYFIISFHILVLFANPAFLAYPPTVATVIYAIGAGVIIIIKYDESMEQPPPLLPMILQCYFVIWLQTSTKKTQQYLTIFVYFK